MLSNSNICSAFEPPPLKRSAVDALTDLAVWSNHVELDLLPLPVAGPHPTPPVDSAAEVATPPPNVPPHPGVVDPGVGDLLLSFFELIPQPPKEPKVDVAAPIIPPTPPPNAPKPEEKDGDSL